MASPPPSLLTADALTFFGGPASYPQWGIFNQDGSPVLAVDSTASVDYARDYRISDYPQEQGAFASYNKVQTPYQAKIGFLIGPSRADFLNNVEAACSSLALVTVVTPEITYANANLVHYGYRRTVNNGVTLIRVDVWCEEVRIAGATQLGQTSTTSSTANGPKSNITSPQSPNGATPAQVGQVQPTPTVTTDPATADAADTLPGPSTPPPLNPTTIISPDTIPLPPPAINWNYGAPN